MLSLLGNEDRSIPPLLPLKITARRGDRASNFVMELGEQASTGRRSDFDGKIDLAADPTVIGSPPPSPRSGSRIPRRSTVPPRCWTPSAQGDLLRTAVRRVREAHPPGHGTDPINLEDGLKPEAVPGLIKGIGDLINRTATGRVIPG